MLLAGHQQPQEMLRGCTHLLTDKGQKDSYYINTPTPTLKSFTVAAALPVLIYVFMRVRHTYLHFYADAACVCKLANLSSSRGSRPCSLRAMAGCTGRWGMRRPEVESFGPVMCGERT